MKKELTENLPSREKYWSEIDVEEKTERLRWEVKKMQKNLSECLKRFGLLEEHSHGDSGLLMPLKKHFQSENYGTRRLKTDNDVYF